MKTNMSCKHNIFFFFSFQKKIFEFLMSQSEIFHFGTIHNTNVLKL